MRRRTVALAAGVLVVSAGTGTAWAGDAAKDKGKVDGADIVDGTVTYAKLRLLTGDLPLEVVRGAASQGWVAQLETALTAADEGLRDAVGGVELRVSDLEAALGTLGGRLSSVEGEADALTERLGTVDRLLAGHLTGQHLMDGTVGTSELAGAYDAWGNELWRGAVTSEKVADRTIEARDLATDVRAALVHRVVGTAVLPEVVVPAGSVVRAPLSLPGLVEMTALSLSSPATPAGVVVGGWRYVADGQLEVDLHNLGAADATLPVTQWAYVLLGPHRS